MKSTFLSLALLLAAAPALAYDYAAELAAQNTPAGWTAVSLPQLPEITAANTFNITDFGASTSSEDNAAAIQAALDACTKAGGGMVVIPAGTWTSGALSIKNKTILHLAAGATLQMTPYGTYPSTVATDFISNPTKNDNDIVIEGEDKETSIIDGQGAPWWLQVEAKNSDLKRGAMVRFNRGSRHLICNLTLRNAPGVNVTLGRSGNASHMTAHDLIIREPSSHAGTGKASHNTDGISVWGPYTNIYNCDISNGDDNVVFDSYSQYGHVWNCTFGDGHGASIGSYTSSMHDILWEDVTMTGTTAGIRMKTNTGRSGNVYNITYRNFKMTGIRENPISITSWYDTAPTVPVTSATDSTSSTPYWHDILIQNVTSTGTTYTSNSNKRGNAIYLLGRPESRMQNITFDNVQVSAARGMYMSYAHGVVFKNNCKITNTRSSSQYFAPDISNFKNRVDLEYSGSFDGSASELDDNGGNTGGNTGGSEAETTDYQLIGTTLKENKQVKAEWNSGVTATHSVDGKTFDTANTDYIKYSAGTITLVLPSDMVVTSVDFMGYGNDASTDAYLSEVGGTEYDADTYVFPAGKTPDNSKSYSVPLATPASGTLTFTVAKKQAALQITLHCLSATGITKPTTITLAPQAIYDLQGRRISADNVSTLRPGIYVVGGKKVAVK